ncbi:phosphoglucosamine mutase [bacterium]|nr:phosphoglucosamine mutase [bacterium]
MVFCLFPMMKGTDMNDYFYPRITISGARGIVGRDITVETAQRMAWAYAAYLGGGDIILGRDARPTGEMMRAAVVAGLLAGGANVIDVGLVPTPTVGIMIRECQAKGGIAITASHNPVEWNALKLFAEDGTFPDQSFVEGYVNYLYQGEFEHTTWCGVGVVRDHPMALDIHCRYVEEAIDVPRIRQKEMTVVVDGCRSVGGIFLPALLTRMGCKVIDLDCTPDGQFTRGMEPTPENLTRLCRVVKEENADIGFAVDPDADRLAVVSNEGQAIGEEFTLALAAHAVLSDRPGQAVATNLSTSMLTDHAAQQFGGTVYRTPIGEANVVTGIREHQAVIGGEGNGGVMYPAVHVGRDAMAAAALVLKLLADTGKTLSAIVAEYPNYIILKDKVEMDLDRATSRLQEIATSEMQGQIDTRDGVKITRENAWLHMRCSNTEPIVRIIAEGVGREETESLLNEGKRLLGG